MLTVGLALLGSLAGAFVGLYLGERQGGDYNFAPAIYMPVGALVGSIVGTVIGEAIS
jgi:hypothetical protein